MWYLRGHYHHGLSRFVVQAVTIKDLSIYLLLYISVPTYLSLAMDAAHSIHMLIEKSHQN